MLAAAVYWSEDYAVHGVIRHLFDLCLLRGGIGIRNGKPDSVASLARGLLDGPANDRKKRIGHIRHDEPN